MTREWTFRAPTLKVTDAFDKDRRGTQRQFERSNQQQHTMAEREDEKATETATTNPEKPSEGGNVDRCNPVVYFEIPVTDLDRAVAFYTAVFGFTFEQPPAVIDGNEMVRFPFSDGATGIGGALVRGDSYRPSTTGINIYFDANDIDETLRRVTERGGSVFYPHTSIGELGSVAEFLDCEGNRIGLHCPKSS
jgi:uncharacterized protein